MNELLLADWFKFLQPEDDDSYHRSKLMMLRNVSSSTGGLDLDTDTLLGLNIINCYPVAGENTRRNFPDSVESEIPDPNFLPLKARIG